MPIENFVCDFNPVLLQITDILAVRYYGIAYVLGFIAVIYFALYQAKIKNLSISQRNLSDLIFYIFVSMVVCARLGYFLFYDPMHISHVFSIWEGGMSFHGGFIGVVVSSILLSRHYKIKLLDLADLLMMPSFLALTFGRIANFFNCEIYGRPADLPWSIIFPRSGDYLPRHPAQLYGAIMYFVSFLILFWYAHRRPSPGKIFFLGMALVGAVRIINELFRRPDYFVLEPITIGQVLSIPLLLAGIAGLIYLHKKSK